MGTFGAGFTGHVLPVKVRERKQVIPTGMDEEDRLPAGDRQKDSNVTWRSRRGELKGTC